MRDLFQALPSARVPQALPWRQSVGIKLFVCGMQLKVDQHMTQCLCQAMVGASKKLYFLHLAYFRAIF